MADQALRRPQQVVEADAKPDLLDDLEYHESVSGTT